MNLAYIGPGSGWLLKGPLPYLGIAVLLVVAFAVGNSVFRGRKPPPGHE